MRFQDPIDKDHKIKTAEISKTDLNICLAICILLVLYRFRGRAHRSKVFEAIKALDFLEIDIKLLDGMTQDKRMNLFENKAQLAVKTLRHHSLGYVDPPLKKDDAGYQRGVWVLSENGLLEKNIKELDDALSENRSNAFIDKMNVLSDIIYATTRKESDESIERKKEKLDNGQAKTEEEITEEVIEQQGTESQSENIEEQNQYQQTLSLLKNMNPYEFESLCVELLNKIGGEWEETPKSRDGGIDGLGYYKIGILRFRVVIQVKRYKENSISKNYVSDFLEAMKDAHAEKGIFITTSDFDSKARNLADKHAITLIAGDELVDLLYDNLPAKIISLYQNINRSDG